MKYTRKEIDTELDYRKLQVIGRAFEADGHDVKLNAKRNELRADLLRIYDEHYAKDDEEKAMAIADKALDEKPESESTEEAVAEGTAESVKEPVVVEEPEPTLYVVRLGAYRDWESGFTLRPGEEPKPLPDVLTVGLKNAIRMKRIIPFEG